MVLPTRQVGLVIHFSYLWRTEFRAGLSEGQKDRPCLIVHVNGDKTFVCPITHLLPPDGAGIEIPRRLKEHLRLDDERSWIIIDECNSFHWPGYDLRPNRFGSFAYGMVPNTFYVRVIKLFVALMSARRDGIVARTE